MSRRTASVQALPPVPAGVCTVLDLPLGPLDLNLLCLMVHLDATQVRITADPAGGLLGSLLCSLAGGVPTTPTTTTRRRPDDADHDNAGRLGHSSPKRLRLLSQAPSPPSPRQNVCCASCVPR